MDEFEREMNERAQAYRVWRDELITAVRGAIERDRGYGGMAEFHRKLLDRIELILTAGADEVDEDGVLVTAPITRRHGRAMLADLALAYGISVADSMPPAIARAYGIEVE